MLLESAESDVLLNYHSIGVDSSPVHRCTILADRILRVVGFRKACARILFHRVLFLSRCRIFMWGHDGVLLAYAHDVRLKPVCVTTGERGSRTSHVNCRWGHMTPKLALLVVLIISIVVVLVSRRVHRSEFI